MSTRPLLDDASGRVLWGFVALELGLVALLAVAAGSLAA